VKISKGERTVTTSVPVVAIDLEGQEASDLLASIATLGSRCCSYPAECDICAPAKRFAGAVRAA
jgi:hypothetical protein